MRRYFEAAGWAVTSSGIQAVVDHVGTTEHEKGDLAYLPDFVVSKLAGSVKNPRSQQLGQAFYVEVKTYARWPENTDRKNFARYNGWGKVLLVWVGPNGLRASWIPEGTSTTVEEADMRPIATVGVVSLRHCDDEDCQREMRRGYDLTAGFIAAMKA